MTFIFKYIPRTQINHILEDSTHKMVAGQPPTKKNGHLVPRFLYLHLQIHTRWAPTSYKLSYNPYKWSVKWVSGVITLPIGIISPFITSRGPPCRYFSRYIYMAKKFSSEVHMFFCDVISRSSELDSWGGHTMVRAPSDGICCGTLIEWTCQVREGNFSHNWGLYVFF